MTKLINNPRKCVLKHHQRANNMKTSPKPPFEGIDGALCSIPMKRENMKNKFFNLAEAGTEIESDLMLMLFSLRRTIMLYNKRTMISWRYSFISDDMTRRRRGSFHWLVALGFVVASYFYFYFYADDVQIKSTDDETFNEANNGTDWLEFPIVFVVFTRTLMYTRCRFTFFCDQLTFSFELFMKTLLLPLFN